ncbi:hypothetical protein P280DRAFT_482562 [Massarina eburnea CBS 473.64]|uniref:Uncharacterized protein n=1 Tax=Massarina eburnea CBS 473.64 TaxID=1395130 RepID=A0A6A6RRC2_9PLEO|nr:hypothetical protein P280DRAFT_482562 [Massarina eburnea CBS 473.64]
MCCFGSSELDAAHMPRYVPMGIPLQMESEMEPPNPNQQWGQRPQPQQQWQQFGIPSQQQQQQITSQNQFTSGFERPFGNQRQGMSRRSGRGGRGRRNPATHWESQGQRSSRPSGRSGPGTGWGR